MPYRVVLAFLVVDRVVLPFVALYCDVLCCIAVFFVAWLKHCVDFVVLSCIVLNCIALFLCVFVLYCLVLCCIVSACDVVCGLVLSRIVSACFGLGWIDLDWLGLCPIVSYCIVL